MFTENICSVANFLQVLFFSRHYRYELSPSISQVSITSRADRRPARLALFDVLPSRLHLFVTRRTEKVEHSHELITRSTKSNTERLNVLLPRVVMARRPS